MHISPDVILNIWVYGQLGLCRTDRCVFFEFFPISICGTPSWHITHFHAKLCHNVQDKFGRTTVYRPLDDLKSISCVTLKNLKPNLKLNVTNHVITLFEKCEHDVTECTMTTGIHNSTSTILQCIHLYSHCIQCGISKSLILISMLQNIHIRCLSLRRLTIWAIGFLFYTVYDDDICISREKCAVYKIYALLLNGLSWWKWKWKRVPTSVASLTTRHMLEITQPSDCAVTNNHGRRADQVIYDVIVCKANRHGIANCMVSFSLAFECQIITRF